MHIKVLFEMRAYNSEAYIQEALDSLISQTDPSWILVVTDNGSKDKTWKILHEYSKKDSRISCVHYEKNFARTPEERHAHRELLNDLINSNNIEFHAELDSDDYYHPQFIEKMYAAAKENNADFVVCGTKMFAENNKKSVSFRIPPNVVINNKKMTSEQFIGLYGSLRPLWGKLYSMELRLKRNEFVPDTSDIKNGSDTFTVLHLLNKGVNKIVSIDEPLHYYRIRSSSQYFSSIDKNRFYEGRILYDLGVETAKTYNAYNSDTDYFLKMVYFSHISDLLFLAIKNSTMISSEKLAFISTVLKDDLFREISYLNPQKTYTLLESSILSILENLTSLGRAKLSNYPLVRMFFNPFSTQSYTLQKAWKLSVLCDLENPLHWGKELYEGISSCDRESIISLVNFPPNDKHNIAKQGLLQAIDEGNYENAATFLSYLLSTIPLDIHVLYLGMYLQSLLGNNINALLFAELAKAFFYDDEDICKMIKTVYKEIESVEINEC